MQQTFISTLKSIVELTFRIVFIVSWNGTMVGAVNMVLLMLMAIAVTAAVTWVGFRCGTMAATAKASLHLVPAGKRARSSGGSAVAIVLRLFTAGAGVSVVVVSHVVVAAVARVIVLEIIMGRVILVLLRVEQVACTAVVMVAASVRIAEVIILAIYMVRENFDGQLLPAVATWASVGSNASANVEVLGDRAMAMWAPPRLVLRPLATAIEVQNEDILLRPPKNRQGHSGTSTVAL